MNQLWRETVQSVTGWLSAEHRRRRGQHRTRIEPLESRLLLTSPYDGEWEWTATNPINPAPTDPGPYFFSIQSDGVSIIEAPDIGGLPVNLKIITVKLKAKGDHIKGKGKSDGYKVKVNLDNRTPNDGPPTEMEGDIHFYGKNVSEALRNLEVQLHRVEG